MQEIQALCGEENDNPAFMARLNAAAVEMGIQSHWAGSRLSKVRTGTQDLSIEDMTVVARIDPKQRGWTYVSYGIPLKRGEDAWAVLERIAKRPKTA